MAIRTLEIEHCIHIDAKPQKVFQYLTGEKELCRWFLAKAHLPAEVGATYEFVWVGGYGHRGRVEAYKKDRLLALSWPVRYGRVAGLTTATYRLAKSGRGTKLRVTHQGFRAQKDWIEIYGACQWGWGYFLTNLKSVLVHGRDLRAEIDE